MPRLTIDKTRQNGDRNNIKPGRAKKKCSEEVGKIQTGVKKFLTMYNDQIEQKRRNEYSL